MKAKTVVRDPIIDTPSILSDADIQQLAYRVQHLEAVQALQDKIASVAAKVRRYSTLYDQFIKGDFTNAWADSYGGSCQTPNEAMDRQKELTNEKEILLDQLEALQAQIPPLDLDRVTATLTAWTEESDTRSQALHRLEQDYQEQYARLEAAKNRYAAESEAQFALHRRIENLKRLQRSL
jgi:cytochrome c556